MSRNLKYFEAIREALDVSMQRDPSVYLVGLGVPDPKGIFGTTVGLQEKYGVDRVMDMPCAENGMTGVIIGSALAGMRPVMTHQRIDFAMLALEQLVNQAAKWHYMFDGQLRVPLVVRLIVGRGWGQGPQHSQSLQALFAHIPGLKVVMPASPADAKGLLIAAIEDDNPVIYIEHRWLHNTHGEVPEGHYVTPIGKARLVRAGQHVTIACLSHMCLEALKAADQLAQDNIDVEIIDVRSLRPFDEPLILDSVRRTGRLVVADTATKHAGFAGEIVACVAENVCDRLKSPPRRICLPECPTPTSPGLANGYYPTAETIVAEVRNLARGTPRPVFTPVPATTRLDVPDKSFVGPF